MCACTHTHTHTSLYTYLKYLCMFHCQEDDKCKSMNISFSLYIYLFIQTYQTVSEPKEITELPLTPRSSLSSNVFFTASSAVRRCADTTLPLTISDTADGALHSFCHGSSPSFLGRSCQNKIILVITHQVQDSVSKCI